MVLCKIDKVLSLLAKVEGAWDLALSCLQSEFNNFWIQIALPEYISKL